MWRRARVALLDGVFDALLQTYSAVGSVVTIIVNNWTIVFFLLGASTAGVVLVHHAPQIILGFDSAWERTYWPVFAPARAVLNFGAVYAGQPVSGTDLRDDQRRYLLVACRRAAVQHGDAAGGAGRLHQQLHPHRRGGGAVQHADAGRAHGRRVDGQRQIRVRGRRRAHRVGRHADDEHHTHEQP